MPAFQLVLGGDDCLEQEPNVHLTDSACAQHCLRKPTLKISPGEPRNFPYVVFSLNHTNPETHLKKASDC